MYKTRYLLTGISKSEIYCKLKLISEAILQNNILYIEIRLTWLLTHRNVTCFSFIFISYIYIKRNSNCLKWLIRLTSSMEHRIDVEVIQIMFNNHV